LQYFILDVVGLYVCYTTLVSCRIRAVEHRKCAAGLAGPRSGLQDRILLNYTRIERAHKVHKKTFKFL